jgi:hypothetical protein
MPITRCLRNGKAGWKWGSNGFCFIGPEAREKARDQALAAIASKARKDGAKTDEEVQAYIDQHSDALK